MRLWLRLSFVLMAAIGDIEVRASTPIVLMIGDSLTEGYNVAADKAYPAQVEQLLRAKFPEAQVRNGGSSGATSAFAKTSLCFQLQPQFPKPQLALLALGANDALRGIAPQETEKNLRTALDILKAAEVPVLLVGMEAPPNYGTKFTQEFRKIYPNLAGEYCLSSYPFLLDGVAGVPNLNLEDGIHPNEAGYALIAQKLLPHIQKALEKGKECPSQKVQSKSTTIKALCSP